MVHSGKVAVYMHSKQLFSQQGQRAARHNPRVGLHRDHSVSNGLSYRLHLFRWKRIVYSWPWAWHSSSYSMRFVCNCQRHHSLFLAHFVRQESSLQLETPTADSQGNPMALMEFSFKKSQIINFVFLLLFLFHASSHCASQKSKQLFIFYSLTLYFLDSRFYLWRHKRQWYSTRDNKSDAGVCSALCDHFAPPLYRTSAKHVKDQCWQGLDQKPEGCKQMAFWKTYLYCVDFLMKKKSSFFFVIDYSAPLWKRWKQRHQLFACGCPACNALT